MSATPHRVSPEVLRELQGLSHTWVKGTKHWQLRIDGKLVAIWPLSRPDSSIGHRNLNVRAAIRRHKRQQRSAS